MAVSHETTPTDAPQKTTMSTVYAHMDTLGYDVSESTVSGYEAAEYDSLRTGAGLLPAWFTGDLAYAVRDGLATPFTLKPELDGFFGESTGSSNVTTLFVREGHGLTDVIDTLHETGQLEVAKARLAAFTDYENTDEVVAFAVSVYAKGWLVERILNETDDFSKGSVSQDKGGIDGYYNGEPVQVKSVTYYASRNTSELEDRDVRVLWYQWDSDGGLHYGFNANDVNAEAASVKGVSKTLIKRSAGNLKAVKESDRDTVRYMWW